MERFIGTVKVHTLAQKNNQWPPTGEFHRCLHWVVTLLSPTKQYCEAGEGPCAELHKSSLHLTGPPRKGDDLET